MGSGPKPVTGYTTTGNVNTDQQFSGPMPWDAGPPAVTPRPPAPPTGGVMPLPAPTQEVKPTGGVTPMPIEATKQVFQQAPSAPQYNSLQYQQPMQRPPMMGGFGGFGGFNPFGGFGGGFRRGFGGYGGGCGHM